MGKTPWLLYGSVLAGACPYFSMGLVTGWMSVSLVNLRGPSAAIRLVESHAILIALLIGVVPLATTVPTGFLANVLGRKTVLMLTAIPLLAAWLMMVFAESSADLVAAMAVAGVGVGMGRVVSSLYISELVEDGRRGSAVSLQAVCLCAGRLVAVSLVHYVYFDSVAWVCATFPVALILCYLWLPESPYFMLLKGRREEAEKILLRVRPSATIDSIKSELNAMEEFVNKRPHGFKNLFTNPVNRRGFLVAVILGVTALGGFATPMEFNFSSLLLPKECEPALIGVQLAVAALLCLGQLADQLRRRTAFLVSASGAFITLTAIGACVYVGEETVRWLQLLVALLFFGVHSLALGTLTAVVTTELFSADVKSPAIGLVWVLVGGMDVAVVASFFFLVNIIGFHSVIWSFAGLNLAGIVLIYFLLPETKGKSFLAIYDEVFETLEAKNKNKCPKLLHLDKQCNDTSYTSPAMAQQPKLGPWPTGAAASLSFSMTHSGELGATRGQRIASPYSLYSGFHVHDEHKTIANIHAPAGIRTRGPSVSPEQ